MAAAQTNVDPAIAYLYSLARNPARPPAHEQEAALRAQIISVKWGSEGEREQKEPKPRKAKRERPQDAAILAKQSERAERRKPKKRKTMKRCTSPSHFSVDPDEEIKYGPDYTLDLPSRERVDLLLRCVSSFYYRPKESHPNGSSVWVDAEYDHTQYPSLDLLMSPVRKVRAQDSWSPREIAIFEAAMCKYPKDFRTIATKCIKTKTTSQVVNFYYTFWKHHAHYRIWKNDLMLGGAEAASDDIDEKLRISSDGKRSYRNVDLTQPAAAAGGSLTVPQSLVSRAEDSSHPRIRMVDPRTGAESFFVLPLSEEELKEGKEEKGLANSNSNSSSSSRSRRRKEAKEEDEKEEEEEDEQEQDEDDNEMEVGNDEDEEAEAEAEAEAEEEEEKVEESVSSKRKKTSAAPPATGKRRGRPPKKSAATSASTPTPKSSSSAIASAATSKPSSPIPFFGSGYRCMVPEPVAGADGRMRPCGKFFKTTNALGSHLHQSHKISKGTSSARPSNHYVEVHATHK